MKVRKSSFNKWKILRQLNKIGSNCDIHPTAYIEGSTIGDNVAIGAGTTIRQSVIGKGAFIGNGVVVEESVIGENNTILNGHIMFSVLYPGTFSFTNILSTSLIGRDTFIGGGVILSDFRFDGKSVSVMKNGNKVDTKNTFIGVCLGHGVYLGAGCIVAPGRMIQSGIRITPERERIIHKSNQNMPGFRSIKS
jgi:NDP-sugar pyrophosphorylase family protein